MTVQFYAAVAATQLQDSPIAIKALERAKSSDFRLNDVYSICLTNTNRLVTV